VYDDDVDHDYAYVQKYENNRNKYIEKVPLDYQPSCTRDRERKRERGRGKKTTECVLTVFY
jgi:hypothetical protein